MLAYGRGSRQDGGRKCQDHTLRLVYSVRTWLLPSSCQTAAEVSQAITVIYFISSSSIPKPPLPNGSDLAKWKERKEAHQATSTKSGFGSLKDATEEVLAAQPSESRPPANSAVPPLDAPIPKEGKMNATFVTLARNSDLWDIVESIRQIEDRFNRRYNLRLGVLE